MRKCLVRTNLSSSCLERFLCRPFQAQYFGYNGKLFDDEPPDPGEYDTKSSGASGLELDSQHSNSRACCTHQAHEQVHKKLRSLAKEDT